MFDCLWVDHGLTFVHEEGYACHDGEDKEVLEERILFPPNDDAQYHDRDGFARLPHHLSGVVDPSQGFVGGDHGGEVGEAGDCQV